MKTAIANALAAALWLCAGAASAQHVVLARHAEKADASRDPLLSTEGMIRAEALAGTFAADGPDLVIVTPLQRTGLTAAPTVAAFGAPIRVIDLDGGVDAHVAAIVAEIAAQPEDSVILVVGHSNTIPPIARALGVESADMADCEYDRLTQVNLSSWVPQVQVTRFGAPSAC